MIPGWYPGKRTPGWKSPGNPTRLARQIFKIAYPYRSWPQGWKVRWSPPDRNYLGWCYHGLKLITLIDCPQDDVVETLVHEMQHMLGGPTFRHGKEFERNVAAAYRRVLDAESGWDSPQKLRELIRVRNP